MAWRDDLLTLRDEVVAAVSRQMGEPLEEDEELARDRAELYQLAASLQVAQMLLDLNELVLSGAGRVESTSLLDYYDDENVLFEMIDPEDDGEEEDADDEEDNEPEDGEELRFSLFWDDAMECAVDVELGKSNGRIYLLVNGDEIDQRREVLETAVLDAFREEMELT